MDKNIIEGNWKRVKGALKKTWGDLTDDEIEKMKGNYDQIVGGLQKKYGYKMDEAASRVNKVLDDIAEPDRDREEGERP